jgi:hypothetical protein
MRAARPWVLVGLVLVSAGCGSAAPGSPSPSAIVASNTQDSIRVTLALEGAPRSGAASWASVRIENLGDRSIRWAGGGCGDPGGIFVDLAGVFPRGRVDWPEPLATFKRDALGPASTDGAFNVGYIAESRWGTSVLCTADLRIETLAAGGSLSMRAGWDGTYEGRPVPMGPATVEAAFPVIGVAGVVPDDQTDSHPVVASLPTTIEGEAAASVLAPALAIDAALADPVFAAWVSGHDPDRWVNPDLARIGDTWQVGLFKTRGGGAGQEYLGVVVDASGRVVDHRAG